MKKTIETIENQIEGLLEQKEHIILAIDGSCTAGKSTLAAALEEKYDCNVFRMDDFFLRPEQRTKERLAETGGNVDYERFREEVLAPLKAGKSFSYRPYDCGAGTLKKAVAVTPKKVNIVEGTYSHHPYFEDPYDLKVFLTVSPEVRRQRIALRPSFLHKRFFEEWIPMEQRYFDAFDIARHSHIQAEPEDNR